MAVQRTQIPISFQYKDGDADLIPIPNGTPVTIINRDTSNPAVVYAAESGSTTNDSPQTDEGGNIPGWLVQGSYLFSTAANSDASPPYAGATIAWESVRGDGVENYYPGSVDGTAIGDAVVDINHLVAAVAQALVPPGTLLPSAASTTPAGYVKCDGASYLRAGGGVDNLFTAIGTAYGSADGTHFNVPDFRGRTIVGANPSGITGNSSFAVRARGNVGGSENHQHTIPSLHVNALAITNMPIPRLPTPSVGIHQNYHWHNLNNANAHAKIGNQSYSGTKCSFTATPMYQEDYNSVDGSNAFIWWVNAGGGHLANMGGGPYWTTALGGITDPQASLWGGYDPYGGITDGSYTSDVGGGVSGHVNHHTDAADSATTSVNTSATTTTDTMPPFGVANVFIKT